MDWITRVVQEEDYVPSREQLLELAHDIERLLWQLDNERATKEDLATKLTEAEANVRDLVDRNGELNAELLRAQHREARVGDYDGTRELLRRLAAALERYPLSREPRDLLETLLTAHRA